MKNVRFWLLVLIAVASRVVSFLYLKAEPTYVLVPRNLLGGGFQVQPALLDVIAPLVVILCLWPGRRSDDGTVRFWRLIFYDAAFLLLFPVVAGLSLFAYEASWHVSADFTSIALLRWLQFVAAFVAWNMLLDELPSKSRLQRIAVVTILVLSWGPLQDAFPGLQDPVFSLLISVGTMLTCTVLVLRRWYRESPFIATLATAIVGGTICVLIVGGTSESLFAALLPALALFLGALTIRSLRWWPRWIALTSIAAIGLLLSLWFPLLFPPAERADILTQEPAPSHAELIEGVKVRYEDLRVRDIATRLAHVLAAANLVSQDVYGISPQVNELVIRGFEEGGFHGEFPHRIVGNLISQRQVDLCLDSSFLNDPNLSIHFPDPVNAILHEYSHLYGVVFYLPWVRGAEEEGWATFSATRLSRRLYERFGPGLWSPPYDYAALAEAITRSNLAGHPVYWSHPNEYGGFRLWYLLSQRDGEVALYRKRWALTRRNFRGWWLQISNPNAARQMAKGFGFADFVSFGSGQEVRYDQVYTLQDAQRVEELLGSSADKFRASYARLAGRLIDPTIKVPAQRPFVVDIVLSFILLAAVVMIKRFHPIMVHGGNPGRPET